jgi:hypothetical protein
MTLARPPCHFPRASDSKRKARGARRRRAQLAGKQRLAETLAGDDRQRFPVAALMHDEKTAESKARSRCLDNLIRAAAGSDSPALQKTEGRHD